jgi:Domain of unknown function (DUF4351)
VPTKIRLGNCCSENTFVKRSNSFFPAIANLIDWTKPIEFLDTEFQKITPDAENRSDILNLFRFVDWVMILPEGLKQTFWEELKTYEEELKMPYITSVEEIGYDRGLNEGKADGERSIVLRLLNRRFRHLNDRTIAQITTLSTTQLEALSDALLDFSAIEDLTIWLDNHSG